MNVRERVKKIMAKEFGISVEYIRPCTNLIKDLRASFVNILNLTTSIEKEFKIHIGKESYGSFLTFQGIIECINKTQ